MRCAVSVFVVGLAAVVGAQEIPTIRVPVRLVSVPTLVFSREGRLLHGLRDTDFRVLDNGRPQAITMSRSYAPVSVVLAIQASRDVRAYTPFIARVGNAVDALLVGETGESAVVTYGDEVTVVKPFGAGDLHTALGGIRDGGRLARALDAGTRAAALLAGRPRRRARVLLFIGQPMDSGSESTLGSLRESCESENIAVYALALPEVGKAFVSDTFSLQGLSSSGDRGGFKTGVDLGKLVAVLDRSANVGVGTDPFALLTAATGGTLLHFRKQSQLEEGIAAIGVELRSAYVLSFYAKGEEAGYHTVKIEVDVPGAKTYSRPGYRQDRQ